MSRDSALENRKAVAWTAFLYLLTDVTQSAKIQMNMVRRGTETADILNKSLTKIRMHPLRGAHY
jgi:hypothetical protein